MSDGSPRLIVTRHVECGNMVSEAMVAKQERREESSGTTKHMRVGKRREHMTHDIA